MNGCFSHIRSEVVKLVQVSDQKYLGIKPLPPITITGVRPGYRGEATLGDIVNTTILISLLLKLL